jgi:hypothetical protein
MCDTYTLRTRSLFMGDKSIFSSERLYKDFDHKGSLVKNKVSSREPQGGWRQDELIDCKHPLVKWLWLWLIISISMDEGYSWWCWNKAALVPNVTSRMEEDMFCLQHNSEVTVPSMNTGQNAPALHRTALTACGWRALATTDLLYHIINRRHNYAEVHISHSFQTGFGVHPASYPMDPRDSFPGVKRPEC